MVGFAIAEFVELELGKPLGVDEDEEPSLLKLLLPPLSIKLFAVEEDEEEHDDDPVEDDDVLAEVTVKFTKAFVRRVVPAFGAAP